MKHGEQNIYRNLENRIFFSEHMSALIDNDGNDPVKYPKPNVGNVHLVCGREILMQLS